MKEHLTNIGFGLLAIAVIAAVVWFFYTFPAIYVLTALLAAAWAIGKATRAIFKIFLHRF